LTTIDPADDPVFGADSLLLEPHEEARNEQQRTVRTNEMRGMATMAREISFHIHESGGHQRQGTNQSSENPPESQ
jgi:hypothetical protein